MTIAERMIEDYGSVRECLIACIKKGMNNTEVSHKYECSKRFIRGKLRDEEIVNPHDGRRQRKSVEPDCHNLTGHEFRKKLTQVCLDKEAQGRAILDAQVTTFRPGDPGFDDLAKLYSPPPKSERVCYEYWYKEEFDISGTRR